MRLFEGNRALRPRPIRLQKLMQTRVFEITALQGGPRRPCSVDRSDLSQPLKIAVHAPRPFGVVSQFLPHLEVRVPVRTSLRLPSMSRGPSFFPETKDWRILSGGWRS